MASLQKKVDSWYCQFIYQRQRHTLSLGEVDDGEAKAVAARVDYLLMRVRQRLLEVPKGVDIVTFIKHDGKPPTPALPGTVSTSFSELRERYLETVGNGSLESNTLATVKIHMNHIAKTLGDRFPMDALGFGDLQRHVNRRQKKVARTTIKKEIDTLRCAWNWACRMGLTQGVFPSAGLAYPKGDEKSPFMTWDEIERRVRAGGDRDLWECLYLTQPEIAELLDHVKQQAIDPWIYPAFVVAAHTGARRSEIMRATPEDVDLARGLVTIREKKRVKGRRTTRRVPLSGSLIEVLTAWMGVHNGGACLFGTDTRMLSPQEVHRAFERAVKDSKWQVMRGWHVLRHSFISALASCGVDQRIIDDFVGHQTDEQRRRYRHLHPSTQAEAIRSVFG